MHGGSSCGGKSKKAGFRSRLDQISTNLSAMASVAMAWIAMAGVPICLWMKCSCRCNGRPRFTSSQPAPDAGWLSARGLRASPGKADTELPKGNATNFESRVLCSYAACDFTVNLTGALMPRSPPAMLRGARMRRNVLRQAAAVTARRLAGGLAERGGERTRFAKAEA